MWHEGTIGIKDKNGKEHTLKYSAKVYDEGSKFGINNGRISKLWLQQDGRTVLNYDRGWDVQAATAEAEIALEMLLKKFA